MDELPFVDGARRRTRVAPAPSGSAKVVAERQHHGAAGGYGAGNRMMIGAPLAAVSSSAAVRSGGRSIGRHDDEWKGGRTW